MCVGVSSRERKSNIQKREEEMHTEERGRDTFRRERMPNTRERKNSTQKINMQKVGGAKERRKGDKFMMGGSRQFSRRENEDQCVSVSGEARDGVEG